nr:gamma carbonic anhydrase family protein [Actinomycetota bacterium]
MTERANVFPYGDRLPEVHPSAFVAPGARVVGKVRVGEESSIWYGAVLRGDLDEIRIGARTSIQDNAVLHMDAGFPVSIGDDCV